jgi:hypothetical protein
VNLTFTGSLHSVYQICVPFPLLRLCQRIGSGPRHVYLFHNNATIYSEKLIAPWPTSMLEDHPLSAVHEFYSVYSQLPSIWETIPPTWGYAMPRRQAHFSWSFISQAHQKQTVSALCRGMLQTVSDKVKRKAVDKNENCSFLHILPFHHMGLFVLYNSLILLTGMKCNTIPDAACLYGCLIYSWECEWVSGFMFVFIGSKNIHYLHVQFKYPYHSKSQVSFSKLWFYKLKDFRGCDAATDHYLLISKICLPQKGYTFIERFPWQEEVFRVHLLEDPSIKLLYQRRLEHYNKQLMKL